MDKRTKIIDEIHDRKAAGEICVFTNGCFDILHPGHIYLLKKASELGNFLVVGLNSDDSTKRLKGNSRPFNGVESRIEVLNAIRFVSYVLVFDEDTPLELIKLVKPDVLVKGGDYTPQTVVGREFIESIGGRVEIIPLLEGYSTSSTLERMEKSES
jgi:rfaE bifunctional protein nucleotidyltransferase chain/domain